MAFKRRQDHGKAVFVTMFDVYDVRALVGGFLSREVEPPRSGVYDRPGLNR